MQSMFPKVVPSTPPKHPSHRSLTFDQPHCSTSAAAAAVRPSASTGSLCSTNTTPSSDAMSSPADSPPTSAARLHHSIAAGVARRTISSDSDDGDIDYSLCSMDDDDCFGDELRPGGGAGGSNDGGTGGLLSYSNHRLPYMYSVDELPVFRCQNMSPGSRSISPIDAHHDDTLLNFSMSPCGSPCGEHEDGLMADRGDGDDMAVDHISLEEIHARLAGDGDAAAGAVAGGTPQDKRLKLETIVEGVFLETPPRGRAQRGAWRVATQSIGKFVEDQRRRRYDAMIGCGGDDGGGDGDDEAADDGDDELCMDEDLEAEGAVGGGSMMDSDMQVDRMRSSFQKKLNMC